MSEMASLVQMQRSEIKVLREEIRASSMEEKVDIRGMMSQVMKERDGMTDAISQKIDAVVKREIKKLAGDFSKQTSQALQHHMRQEAAKSDASLRDAISKMAHSKTAMDAMGLALTNSLAPILQASFKDLFTSVVTPAFERSMQNLFSNLSQSFTKGTKEYEAVLKSQSAVLTKEVREAVRILERSKANQANDIDKTITGFRDVLVSEMREVARQQRSLSGTPVMTPASSTPVAASGSKTAAERQQELKMEIVNMLRRQAFNDAFTTALIAMNLELVVMTCEMVNPTQLFSQTPCPLSQENLLCLIQQLGSKLHDRTELKLKYLEEAVTNLNTEDPSILQHIKVVADQLMKQLQEYMTKYPQQKFSKNMKMLYMAT